MSNEYLTPDEVCEILKISGKKIVQLQKICS